MKPQSALAVVFCVACQLIVLPAVAQSEGPRLTVADGFRADLIHTVDSEQHGSWVALTTDPQGRLITSDQKGKLYRLTLPAADGQSLGIETIDLDIGHAQGLLCAFDSLYVMVNQKKKSGLYRVRDTDGDDDYDDSDLLIKLDGRGEHGPHAVVLAPDGQSLYFCCGNHTKLPELSDSRLPQNWSEDQIIPRLWDANGHAQGILAPGGYICQVAPDGKNCRLVAAGFRNAYDIAFDADGELFTFDSDMEWDVGLPWHRPTRVNHAVSGAEFGWRSGSGKWPAYYPDSLPAVIDIGPGSPTGVAFGTGTNFPVKYQRALYAADWSYGQLYAIHLTPEGASYRGGAESFVAGTPFPITDIAVRTQDGAMYVTTGGRGVQSRLYRVCYVGRSLPANAATGVASVTTEVRELRRLRHTLEQYHTSSAPATAIEAAWPLLSHSDRHLRYAARLVLEHQSPERWRNRALAAGKSGKPYEVLSCCLALARAGQVTDAEAVLSLLGELEFRALTTDQQIDAARCCQLILIRIDGVPGSLRTEIADRVSQHYPAEDWRLNRELCGLMAHLRAPSTVEKTLRQLAGAIANEDRIHYLTSLRLPGLTWTVDQRRKYLQHFNDSMTLAGGHSYQGFLRRIFDEVVEGLSEGQRNTLAEQIAAVGESETPATGAAASREFVRAWTVDDLVTGWKQSENIDVANGKRLFAEVQCTQCHRYRGYGGIMGPDLTGVAGRFELRDLLSSMIQPNQNVSDQYQWTIFELTNGKIVTGRIVNLSGDEYHVMSDMSQPDALTKVKVEQIEAKEPSPTSAMPTGLLNTMTADEIRDLVGYLRGEL